jgi:putative aldouronate transport system substrate-binding protein
MIAGGVYPDLLKLNDAFIEAGALLPLEDLIEQYAPNIKAHYADAWEKMKYTDGHIYDLVPYGVSHGQDHNDFYNGSAFWVQKAVLKDAGYPVIVTIDQFFDMIADYYRKNPTIDGQPTIPFTILTDDWRAFELWNPPNFLAGFPNDGNGTVDPVTHEYKNFFTQDISKRWFRKLNELDKQGLIDKAAFTDTYDQYIAKIATGRVLGLFGQQWQFDASDYVKRDRGENIRTMAPLPVVFDGSVRPNYRNPPVPNIYTGLCISVSAKDPVRIIRFLNNYMEEDIQRTMHWGIEGEDWQYNDQGIPYRTPQQRANWRSQSWQDQNRAAIFSNNAPKLEGSYSDGFPYNLSDLFSEREAMLSPEDRELFAAYGVTGFAEMMDKNPRPNSLWFPAWTIPNPPDSSPAQIALQRCEQTMKRLLPRMILAPTDDFDRLWDEYVREMEITNNIGLYEQYMQQMLDRRIKDWSSVK